MSRRRERFLLKLDRFFYYILITLWLLGFIFLTYICVEGLQVENVSKELQISVILWLAFHTYVSCFGVHVMIKNIKEINKKLKGL